MIAHVNAWCPVASLLVTFTPGFSADQVGGPYADGLSFTPKLPVIAPSPALQTRPKQVRCPKMSRGLHAAGA